MIGHSATDSLATIQSLGRFWLIANLFFGSAVAMDMVCPDFVVSHAPMIRLHSEELYMPSDIARHIKHTTPMLAGRPIEGLPPLDPSNLDVLNEYGEELALTSNDDPLESPSWIFGDAPDGQGYIRNSTSCVVVLVEKSETDVDAFYFYFYSYNRGQNISQVLEPLDSLVDDGKLGSTGMHFGNHVGDWEHNMIRFHRGRPQGIWYSQHVSGQAYSWDDPRLSIQDNRPTVYSALGSHANYISSGDHLIHSAVRDLCDDGREWDPVASAVFFRYNALNTSFESLQPPRALERAQRPQSVSFLNYIGRWGDHRYPDSDPRQYTVPHFGIKRFETGPNGPRYKSLIRKGVQPDKSHVRNWTEWGVAIFMALYPVAFRGWRKWVTLGCLLSLVGGGIFAFVVFIRRRKGKSYMPLRSTDEFTMQDWREERASDTTEESD